ncbi:MAG: CDP-diacylglycerol--glycerol-3-phosphate 3-phosphatidyltransferase [Candidatus Woesearchaeota archaeon]
MVTVANTFTLARIALVPVFIAILYSSVPGKEWIAAAVFCIAAATDAFDGYLARKYNQISKIGTLLDPVADKLLVISALIFLIGRGVPAWMAWVLIAREFVIVSLRLLVAPQEAIVPTTFGKLKTALEMIGVVGILLNIGTAIYVLLGAVIFSVISGLQYILRFRKAIKL